MSCSPGGEAQLKGSKMVWQQKDSNNENIDYLTRSYTIRTSDTVSILAQQKSDSFVSWTSPYDDDYYVYRFVDGNYTAEQMLEDLEAENNNTMWILRACTLVGVILGLVMITAPLSVIPDVIPLVGDWIGDLVGTILWAVSCSMGCCCWTFVTGKWLLCRVIVYL